MKAEPSDPRDQKWINPEVRLTNANLGRFGQRQWGYPTGMYVGRAWRTREADGSWSLSVAHQHPDQFEHVIVRVYPVRRVRRTVDQFLPPSVCDAFLAYWKLWPHSMPSLNVPGVIMTKPFCGWISPRVFKFKASSGYTMKVTINGTREAACANEGAGEIPDMIRRWYFVAATDNPADLEVLAKFAEENKISVPGSVP